MTEQIWTPVITLSDVGENRNIGNDISLVARSSGGGCSVTVPTVGLQLGWQRNGRVFTFRYSKQFQGYCAIHLGVPRSIENIVLIIKGYYNS